MAALASTSQKGEVMHFSVGAVIERGGKILLLDRSKYPFGFAAPAGHVDEGETPQQAVDREVEEETGLRVVSKRLLNEEEQDDNLCSRGVKAHHWTLYACEVTGELRKNSESKSLGWYTRDELRTITLEPAWERAFKKLHIL